jgi:putative Mg2+ transporter-C (MgtC) family protein
MIAVGSIAAPAAPCFQGPGADPEPLEDTMFGIDVDWQMVASHLVNIAIAYVLALPIAWNREADARSAGLRTFPIVAVAACGFMLTGVYVLDTTDAEARVMYGLMTGIGFIGGGAILKEKSKVLGTATAASIWNTGAIGMSVAYRRYEIALVLSLVNFITLLMFGRIKENMDEEGDEG